MNGNDANRSVKTKVITIDGPAGAGKTSISKILSRRLGWIYVDTGSLYRAVALEVDRRGINWKDENKLADFLNRIDIDYIVKKGEPVLVSSGEDITGMIRTHKISMLASHVSSKPVVRAYLLDMQRTFALKNNAVFEGRDMGTVVFPEADFKFFLFADLKIRALRRFREMKNKNHDFETVKQDMAKRDENDSNRKHAPLKPADDAVLIDSTDMTLEQVVDKMLGIIGKV